MQQINTFEGFLDRVNSLDVDGNIQDSYDVFEYECTDEVRDYVLGFADDNSPEPFRSAMYNLGFKDY